MSVKNLMTIYLTFRNWIFCFSILLFSTGTLRSEAIITFEHSGGRLGDNLISYLHAKWLSYTTGIPLQCNYCGFKYAKSLRMFSKEVDFSHAPHPSVNLYVNKMDFQFRPAESVCYIIPYFPEFESELDTGAYKRLVAVDWEDPDFRDIALDMISSTIPLRLMLPPANMVNVALHLREGGNFDVDDVRFKFPLKLPPLHFYCDALKKVAALFQGQPIHCQIFTDAINPEVLVELIKKELPSGHNIQFDYRKQANDDEDNVLDDFFSLFHYDVLIRPESNFSKVPDLLHDFAVVISPKHAVLSTNGGRNSVRVDEMQTKIDEFMYQICLTRWDATDRFN